MWKKISTPLMLCVAAAALPLSAMAQQAPQPPAPLPPERYYYGPHMWMWGDGYGWHSWWMFPMMLMILLLVGAAVFFLGHGMASRGGWRANRQWDDPALSALQILNERFARGEIPREEYEEKKAVLLFGGRR